MCINQCMFVYLSASKVSANAGEVGCCKKVPALLRVSASCVLFKVLMSRQVMLMWSLPLLRSPQLTLRNPQMSSDEETV